MAHRAVVIPGTWKAKAAMAEGTFFQVDADVAGQVEVCAAKKRPFGVIPVYPSPTDANNPKQDPAHTPPTRGQAKDELVYGHHAGPPSEIIEVKMAADQTGTANHEVGVGAAGEAVVVASNATDTYVVGIVQAPWKDGDIKECQIVPRTPTT